MDPLTVGAMKLYYNGNTTLAPTIQVFSIEQIGSEIKDTLRYRLYISDDIHKHHATLPKKYNKYRLSEDIKVGKIVCLAEYSCLKSTKMW